MKVRKLPPSKRPERFPRPIVEFLKQVVAKDVEEIPEGRRPVVTDKILEELAIAMLSSGRLPYRRDSQGVYHVELPGADQPFPIPPEDFPRGNVCHDKLISFAEKQGVRVPERYASIPPGENDEIGCLHLILALALLTDMGTKPSYASEEELAYFIGRDD